MSPTRSNGRDPGTPRTASRRPVGGASRSRTTRARATGATATLEREPGQPEPGAAATPTRQPVEADLATPDRAKSSRVRSGRARTGRGPRSRTGERQRTPRHRILLAGTAAMALGMLVVLVLNTLISQGAFRQHELEITLIYGSEDEEKLASALDLAESPIEVEKRARALGMVPAAAPVFLRLSDGKLLGEPVPAPAATGPVDFTDAPGIRPTPSPTPGGSGGASASPAAGTPMTAPSGVTVSGAAVDPALDPATGLETNPQNSAEPQTSTAPQASPAPTASPAPPPTATAAVPTPAPTGDTP